MSALLEMQTFLEIVDRGSLSAAARALATVPSTISARLTALEDRLGVRLVVRSTRRLRITADGERYLVDCRRILDDVERSEACIRQGTLRGSLRITAPSDLGRSRLRPILDAFMDAHPRIDVHLHLSDEVVDLVAGGFDAALRVGQLRDSSLVARRLAGGHRVICAAPSYWASHPRPTAPADLAQHECLLWTSDGRNEAAWTFAGTDGADTSQLVRVRGRRSSNDGELVRAWALAGLGVAQKSLWDVERDLNAFRLESVLTRFVRPADLYVVYPSGRNLPRRTRSLVDHLVDAFHSSASRPVSNF